MSYGFYNVTLILEDEQEERLQELVKRYEKINDWKGKDLMQFSTCIINKDLLLDFLESKAKQIEIEQEKEYNDIID